MGVGMGCGTYGVNRLQKKVGMHRERVFIFLQSPLAKLSEKNFSVLFGRGANSPRDDTLEASLLDFGPIASGTNNLEKGVYHRDMWPENFGF